MEALTIPSSIYLDQRFSNWGPRISRGPHEGARVEIFRVVNTEVIALRISSLQN